jgi:hypothetical protein
MTILTKSLAILCGILAVACAVLWGMNASKARVIQQQQRSIEYGAQIARANAVAADFLKAQAEASRKESAERLCRIEELESQLHAPTTPRPMPRSKRELRESVRRAITTR